MVLWSLAGGIELPPWITVNIPCFLNGTLTSFYSLIRQNRSGSHPSSTPKPSIGAGESQSEGLCVLRNHWLAAAPHFFRASASTSQPLMYLCLTSADPNNYTHLLIGHSHARQETLRVGVRWFVLTLVLVVGTRRSRATYLRGVNCANRAHTTSCSDAVRCNAVKQHTTSETTISDRLWLEAIDARGGGGLMREVKMN